MEYYIIVNEKSMGPYSAEDLASMSLFRRDSLVWREGLDGWTEAGDIPELESLFVSPQPESAALYYAMSGNDRIGPMSAQALVASGRITPSSLVWREGMANWAPASEVPGFDFSSAGTYRQQTPPPYNPGASRGDFASRPYYPVSNSPWFAWAIVATAVNFLSMWAVWFPIVGVVFGILGIVYCNEYKTRRSLGQEELAAQSESNARTMTIVALAIAGLALLGGIFFAVALGTLFTTLASAASAL